MQHTFNLLISLGKRQCDFDVLLFESFRREQMISLKLSSCCYPGKSKENQKLIVLSAISNVTS